MAQERSVKKSGKRKLDNERNQATQDEESDDLNELADESVLRLPKWSKKEDVKKCVYFILENASLESAKFGTRHELLCGEKHRNYIMKKLGKDPATYRPDIAHQCLLMLLDSPLCLTGHLRVYVHTANNVLIEVNPQTRIPRTFDRFAGLIVQLLHKQKIRAEGSSQTLLRLVRNPVTDHLPTGCDIVSTSVTAPLTAPRQLVEPYRSGERPVAIVVGAFAHGHLNVSYAQRMVAINSYPLSGALCCAKLCDAFEEAWNII